MSFTPSEIDRLNNFGKARPDIVKSINVYLDKHMFLPGERVHVYYYELRKFFNEAKYFRSIASGFISSSPQDANLTAFATGADTGWTVDGVLHEINREFKFDSYDAEALAQLQTLRDYFSKAQR